MNGVQTRLKCKPNVKQCKRLVFPARSALFNHNILNTKAISHFQANHILIRFVFPPLLDDGTDLEYVPSEITLDLSGKASEKTAGARMKKYELDASATNDGKLQSNDIVLFRYADVLLMKSEAKVRNGGNGDAELTEVRERAGATLDVTATLETLLEERLREFAWEGLRRQDLVRFGKFTRAYTDRPQLPKEDTGYTTVFPIHEDVLSLNGKLTQNYGY